MAMIMSINSELTLSDLNYYETVITIMRIFALNHILPLIISGVTFALIQRGTNHYNHFIYLFCCLKCRYVVLSIEAMPKSKDLSASFS